MSKVYESLSDPSLVVADLSLIKFGAVKEMDNLIIAVFVSKYDDKLSSLGIEVSINENYGETPDGFPYTKWELLRDGEPIEQRKLFGLLCEIDIDPKELFQFLEIAHPLRNDLSGRLLTVGEFIARMEIDL